MTSTLQTTIIRTGVVMSQDTTHKEKYTGPKLT